MANAGYWSVSGGYSQVIVDGKNIYRYRIFCASTSKVDAKVTVDTIAVMMKPGESRDFAGKKIQIQITSNQGGAQASGTYDNLD